MVSSKILWNSVISTKDARFAGADIKNMYLETPLDQYEYMKMPIALFPADIIDHYGLNNKVLDGYVYMEIQKGMYGLPQAGVLANKLLIEIRLTYDKFILVFPYIIYILTSIKIAHLFWIKKFLICQ